MPRTETPRWVYHPPKAEVQAVKENPFLGGVSSGLGYLRDSFDTGNLLDAMTLGPVTRALHGDFSYRRPPTTHSGVGTLMMGHAPEEVREWASGFSPFSEEPNLGNRLDPRIKAGREQGLMDVALTGADVAGLGLAGLRGGVRAAYPTLNPEMNMSRREFISNTGKAAAGLAAASAVPFALRGAEHVAPVVRHVAPHAAAAVTRVAPHTFHTAERVATRIAAAHGEAVHARVLMEELAKTKEKIEARAHMDPAEYGGHIDEDFDDIINHATNSAYQRRAEAEAEKHQEIMDDLRKDPKYQGIPTKWELEMEAHQEAARKAKNDFGVTDDDLFLEPESYYHRDPHVEAARQQMRRDNGIIENQKFREHGYLDPDEVVELLRSGKEYADPFTGNRAILNEGGYHGNIMWESPEGARRAHQYRLEQIHEIDRPPEEHLVHHNERHYKDGYEDVFDLAKTARQIKAELEDEVILQLKQRHHDITEPKVRKWEREHGSYDDEPHNYSDIELPDGYRAGGRVRII